MTVSEHNLDHHQRNQTNLLAERSPEEWHLLGLLDRSIDAVIVPNYYTEQECTIIADRIKKSDFFRPYPDHPSVSRFGQELFECQNLTDLANQYKSALSLVQEMRVLMHPYISPIDKIRLELDDLWSHGCSLANVGGQKVFAGMIREYYEENPSLPHCDVMG